jgi:hypothetical protein
VVERAYGRGRVLLANIAPVANWTYLPARIEFPIFVQEVLRYVVGNPDAAVNLSVGDTFRHAAYSAADYLLLRYPDGSPARVHPESAKDDAEFRMLAFNKTSQQGPYTFDVPEQVMARRRFVVNGSALEADLQRLHSGDVSNAFGSGGWSWIRPETSLAEFVSKLHSVTEIAPWVLAALALILALESFLAARFGRRRGGATQ